MYNHEIDALNALVKAVERNNELLQQIIDKQTVEQPKTGTRKGNEK